MTRCRRRGGGFFYKKQIGIKKKLLLYSPSDSVVCDDQSLVVGNVEYPVASGADVVVGTGAGYALSQRAVPGREMVYVTVVQRVPGVVFG